jgi:hypothetical protein
MTATPTPRTATMMSRRRLIVGAASLGASLTIIAACSSDPSEILSPGTKPPSSTSITELTITTSGGFVPWQFAAAALPEMTVTDAKAIYLGPVPAIYPGPALPNVLTRSLDADALAAITKVLTDAKLDAPAIDYGTPNVTDLPGTTVQFTLGGKSFSQSAYALSYQDDDTSLSQAQRAARATLRDALAKLTNLEALAPGHLGAEQPYKATSYETWGSKYVDPGVTEEPQQPIIDWPHADIDLSSLAGGGPSCIAADATVEATFAKANTMSVFRQGDVLVQLIPRPMLPGETACKRTGN